MCRLHREGDENSGEQRRPILLSPGAISLLIFDVNIVQDGYQHNVTSAMTVELLKDLLASAGGKQLEQQGKLFFAHSETFLPLLVALGVAKDEVRMNEQSKYSFLQVIRAHSLTTASTIRGEHAN